jgi:hypothetical protein
MAYKKSKAPKTTTPKLPSKKVSPVKSGDKLAAATKRLKTKGY